MKKVFKIYPALFVLTANNVSEPVLSGGKLRRGKINSDSKDDYFLKGLPQKYRGHCSMNESRSLLSIRYSQAVVPYSTTINLPEIFFTPLEPVTHVGKHYSLTYVCVNN